MQEDFLHYVWQFQKLSTNILTTTSGDELHVINIGEYNTDSGPDFKNSKLRIDGQVWFGTVEVHVKSSDWFVHKHQNDLAYNNVILHVVWEDDIAVYDAHNNQLQTLVLKEYVNELMLFNYKKLLEKKNWINCENQIHQIDEFTMSFWKEKLMIRRMERKSLVLQKRLTELNNDWEALLFLILAENFGLKLNSDHFFLLARSVTFTAFKKEVSNLFNMEALLFGQANLLNEEIEDLYYKKLKTEYGYLKQKYRLVDSLVMLQFFRLRPASFPTLRLSQFAMMYHSQQGLFSKIIEAKSVVELRRLFEVSASDYWDTHYTFGKTSIKRIKSVSKGFVELLMINAIIPLKFMYARSQGAENFEELLKLYHSLQPEQNTLIKKFENLKVTVNSSADSQALIELKTTFCDKQKCLHCEIGNKLLYQS